MIADLPLAAPAQLLPAREQMAFTLMFHLVLVPLGVALPTLMLVANYKGLRHHDDAALRLARRWSHAAGLLFAVGAASGTVLSFEMGLLWPGLTGRFGDVFGIPFAVEGIAFFLEAIFVAVYIYGWRRLRPWTHFWLGLPDPVHRADRHHLDHLGERLDERARRLHPGRERPAHPRRPAERDLQPGPSVRAEPLLLGGLHGRGVHRRVGLRGGLAARAARPLSPVGLPHPVLGRRDAHAGAVRRR